MLWKKGVTVRHILLTVAALAVFGLGVYLFLEVRATPATADVPRRPAKDKPARVEEDVAPPESAAPETRQPSTVSIPKNGNVRVQTTQPTSPPEPVKPQDVGKLDALMSEANKAYDRGEFDEAQTIAQKALTLEPTNTRMLRIMVSAACIDGNSIEAQKWYLQLPAPDREQMKTRCDRYGITFNEK